MSDTSEDSGELNQTQTPKIIKPPCKSSYEEMKERNLESKSEDEEEKSKLRKVAKKRVCALTTISNYEPTFEKKDKSTKIYIDIRFCDVEDDDDSSNSTYKPDDLKRPIRSFMRMVKKDLKNSSRRSRSSSKTSRSSIVSTKSSTRTKKSKSSSRTRKSSTRTKKSSSTSSKSTSSSNSKANDEYQDLVLLCDLAARKQQLPDILTKIPADILSVIPDDKLPPKKFSTKMRREYVVIGELNKKN